VVRTNQLGPQILGTSSLLLFGVKDSLSLRATCPLGRLWLNFLDGQTHWKMGKTKDGRCQEDTCRAGFAANEVNPSPNRLPGNMLLPTLFYSKLQSQ
jgi:hypothetical protein